MKMKMFLVMFIIVPLISSAQKPLKLFNGKNLKEWVIVLKDDAGGVPVFNVTDGLIHASGTPFGYIRTKKSFKNYELTLEWRWVGEPTNSGVLIHITGNDGVWPHCIEAQLKHGNAGDLVLMHTGAKATVNNQEYVIKEGDRWVTAVAKLNDSSEKGPGEWNQYRIVSFNGKLELYVNDVLQNTATNFSPDSGFIGLQSEGSPIQFRKIYLRKLK